MTQPTFEYEQACREAGRTFVIGIDEAGRGPLAGPVVAAAVCYRDQGFAVPETLLKDFALIRDSKKLSAKQRERVFALIHEHFHVGIGFASHEVIDHMNILQATFLAMKGAFSQLRKLLPQEGREEGVLLVDGNQLIPNISYAQEVVTGGDASVRSIAAASIIAKVTRDRLFEEFENQFPGYGFAQHKGYGTATHLAALKRLGPCAIHRQSFRPVALCNPEEVNRRYSGVLQSKK